MVFRQEFGASCLPSEKQLSWVIAGKATPNRDKRGFVIRVRRLVGGMLGKSITASCRL